MTPKYSTRLEKLTQWALGAPPDRVRWIYLLPIALLHALALLALLPSAFSWVGVAIMVVGVHVFGQGINLCYHRCLTHRSFRLTPWVEHLFTILAVCCMQDAPARWVAHHRRHHQHSDDNEDPHSPRRGRFWSHAGWLFVDNPEVHSMSALLGYSRDILEDPFYFWLERRWNWIWIYLGHALLFFLAGTAASLALGAENRAAALATGASILVWGVFVRTVVVWHITWSVNSLTHLAGYRNYETSDDSRNNWLVALLTVGEGWHNNHHHDPTSASNQRRWWEFDVTYWEVCLLALLGLASDIVPPKDQRARRREPTAIPLRRAA